MMLEHRISPCRELHTNGNVNRRRFTVYREQLRLYAQLALLISCDISRVYAHLALIELSVYARALTT